MHVSMYVRNHEYVCTLHVHVCMHIVRISQVPAQCSPPRGACVRAPARALVVVIVVCCVGSMYISSTCAALAASWCVCARTHTHARCSVLWWEYADHEHLRSASRDVLGARGRSRQVQLPHFADGGRHLFHGRARRGGGREGAALFQ